MNFGEEKMLNFLYKLNLIIGSIMLVTYIFLQLISL